MLHARLTLLLPVLLAIPLIGQAQLKSAAPPTILKAGKSVNQSMRGGETYDYLVALKAGEALKATVEQQGIDVVVTAFGPDGTKIAEFDSPTATTYKEFVTVVAPTAGRYRLAATSFEPKAAGGTYVMSLNSILTPEQYAQSQADDRKRADAVAAYLQTPHPDKSAYEQRMEMLKLDPAAYMPAASQPEVEAARWLEGTWATATKGFATPTEPEIVFPVHNNVLRFDAKNPTVLKLDSQGKGNFEPFMTFEPHSRQWVQGNVETNEAGTGWSLLKGAGWHNNQLVLQGEAAFMGIASFRRDTWTKTDANSLRVLSEERNSSGAWTPISETTYTRAAPASLTAK